jgi:hypothetical protein
MTRSLPIARRLVVPALVAFAAGLLLPVSAARAGGKLSWLDEVVQTAIKEAETGGKAAARAETRAGERLLVRGADESLEAVARRSDDLARSLGRRIEQPAEAALDVRFNRLVRSNPEMARTFGALQPAEKRLVVEMGESAQMLARRYPGQAETMVRKLGVDGLTAVRAYGDDVAQVIVREGPESVNVLRQTGRAGWSFFTDKVLPNKGKLAAAGVLGLFLANPEKFVDTAGNVTQYAVEQFAKAGIQLAGAIGGGAAEGLGKAISDSLGINTGLGRALGIAAAVLVAILALMVLLGLPLRALTWPFRTLGRLVAIRVRPSRPVS